MVSLKDERQQIFARLDARSARALDSTEHARQPLQMRAGPPQVGGARSFQFPVFSFEQRQLAFSEN
jgi:hypothetical protein